MKRIGLFLLTNLLVITVATIILSFLGVGQYITGNTIHYGSLAVFCLVYGMIGSFISLALSRWMAKKMMGVQVLDPQGPQASFVSRVHQLAKSAGLAGMPEVGIYESAEVNAFATGPSEKRSLVAVSTGLLNSMNQDEVDGVLAHEIAHIKNGDMVTMTLLQGVLNAFVMFLARVAAFFVGQFFRGEDDESPIGGLAYFVTVIVFQIIFGILASFVIAWFSRLREFRADAGGAAIAGRGKMTAALEKLKQLSSQAAPAGAGPDNMQAFKISSPGKMMALMSTHPPLEKRIKALQRV